MLLPHAGPLELWLSASTVETHVRNIFLKLDLHPRSMINRRVAAALAYLETHLIAAPAPA